MTIFYSPAKVNLFLRVVRKRADGYHELASLFQTVSLFDILHIDLNAHTEDILTCSDPTIPTNESNLILKAAHLYRKKTQSQFGLHIHLEKCIPAQAGLGGGSSNAATTLWALNKLLGHSFSDELLAAWSAEIGSDIPFFFSHGTAYCTGRGEIVKEVVSHDLGDLTIIKPAQGLSTPLVYQNLKLSEIKNHDPEHALDQYLHSTPLFFNDLEKPAFAIDPNLETLKKKLLQNGVETVLMTGSGSAFFCLGNIVELPKEIIFSKKVHCTNRAKNMWYKK